MLMYDRLWAWRYIRTVMNVDATSWLSFITILYIRRPAPGTVGGVGLVKVAWGCILEV